MDQIKRLICCTAVFVGMATGVCFGDENEEKARSRLKEMKGDDVQAAMVAEMELVSMGDKALGPLKKIIDDAKDADRLEAMKVYPRLLEKAGRLTRVSLDFNDAKLSEAISELGRQCKTPAFDPGSLGSSKVTIHREKVPYCLALAELCQQADGAVAKYAMSGKVALTKDPGSKNRPICEDWGSVVILDSINQKSSLEYSSKDRNRVILDFQLQMMLDPGVKTYLGGYFKDVEATDEAGRPLSHVQDKMDFSLASTQNFVNVRGLLMSAPAEMKKLSILKGKMLEHVGYGFETWTLDDATQATGKSRDFGSLKLDIRSATLSGSQLVVKFTLSGIPVVAEEASGSASRYLMENLIGGDALKVDSAGVKTAWRQNSVSFNMGSPAGDDAMQFDVTITMTNSDVKTDKPPSIRFIMPRKLERIQIGFEFKDIDL